MSLKTNREDLDKTIEPGGQQKDYLILSEEERAKGFVRPVRTTYRHVGTPAPRFPLCDLDDSQKHLSDEFVKFEPYPESERPMTGKYWTSEDIKKVGQGCGTTTTMSLPIAETYSRSPGFYGATFCAYCCCHLPVGKDGEFTWLDGTRVGT